MYLQKRCFLQTLVCSHGSYSSFKLMTPFPFTPPSMNVKAWSKSLNRPTSILGKSNMEQMMMPSSSCFTWCSLGADKQLQELYHLGWRFRQGGPPLDLGIVAVQLPEAILLLGESLKHCRHPLSNKSTAEQGKGFGAANNRRAFSGKPNCGYLCPQCRSPDQWGLACSIEMSTFRGVDLGPQAHAACHAHEVSI